MRTMVLAAFLLLGSRPVLDAQVVQQKNLTATTTVTTLDLTAAVVLQDLTVRPIPLLALTLTALADTSVRFALRTGLNGKASQVLQQGKYKLSSVSAVHVGDSSYAWNLIVAISGTATSVELSNANAIVTHKPSTTVAASAQVTPKDIYLRAQGGVFRVEAGLGHGSGFLIDELGGVVVTNDNVVVDATSATKMV